MVRWDSWSSASPVVPASATQRHDVRPMRDRAGSEGDGAVILGDKLRSQASIDPDLVWGVDPPGALQAFLLDTWAAWRSAMRVLWSAQTLVVAVLAIGSPCFFFYYRDQNGDPLAFDINWSLIALAVVFPLTMSVTEAFRRREAALTNLAYLKSSLASIYYAHRDWSWDDKATALRPGHLDDVVNEIRGMLIVISALLHKPVTSKARHRFTASGRQVRERVQAQKARLEQRIRGHYGRLSALAEEIKQAGLPQGETSRLRQYFTYSMQYYELLMAIKMYRTPLGIRNLARIYILLTPIVMGPYYSFLAGARDNGSGDEGVGLPFACFFSLLASMAMQGIYAVRDQMEDPFVQSWSNERISLGREFDSIYNLLASEPPAAVAPLRRPPAASASRPSSGAQRPTLRAPLSSQVFVDTSVL